jgi:hypothetical protein
MRARRIAGDYGVVANWTRFFDHPILIGARHA